MSELSNEPSIPEEPLELGEEQAASQGTMLVTMLLLIAGFLLSSAMLLHYGFKAAPSEDGRPGFDLAAFKAKKQAFTEQLKKAEKPEPAEARQTTETQVATAEEKKPEPSGGIKLFGSKGDKVRWPKLKLTGFGSSSEGSGGFAIINDKQYHPGQVIDGKAKVVEIRSQDVVVEYMGETRTLTVNVQDH